MSIPATPNEAEQWAIKQHLEKYPKCEWICTHTNRPNLGETEEKKMNKPKPIEFSLHSWSIEYETEYFDSSQKLGECHYMANVRWAAEMEPYIWEKS